MSLTLGIDASTTTAGWAVVKDNNKIVDAGFIDLSKHTTNPAKAKHFIQTLSSKSWIRGISRINIEAALSGFAGGKTSQQVIIKLARFNAVFCYIMEENYKIPVHPTDVRTLRKQLFGSCRIKGMKPKEFVKSSINIRFDLSPWTVFNKKGNEDIRMDDLRDGVVAAFYH